MGNLLYARINIICYSTDITTPRARNCCKHRDVYSESTQVTSRYSYRDASEMLEMLQQSQPHLAVVEATPIDLAMQDITSSRRSKIIPWNTRNTTVDRIFFCHENWTAGNVRSIQDAECARRGRNPSLWAAVLWRSPACTSWRDVWGLKVDRNWYRAIGTFGSRQDWSSHRGFSHRWHVCDVVCLRFRFMRSVKALPKILQTSTLIEWSGRGWQAISFMAFSVRRTSVVKPRYLCAALNVTRENRVRITIIGSWQSSNHDDT